MAGSKTSRIKVLEDESRSKRATSSEATVSLQGLTSHLCEKESRQTGDCLIVFPQSAYRQVVDHLSEDTSREHGGFLLGYETWSEEAHAPVVVVEHAIPAKHTSGTPVRLTFTKESWRDLDGVTDKLSKNGRVPTRVGWYHSHPNISIFLSHWDLDVCKEFDRRQYPIALVVDPVNRRGGFFVRGKSGYRPRTAQGFLELHDLQKDSVVDWTNMAHGEKESVAVSDQREEGAPPEVVDLLKLQKQLEDVRNRLDRVSSRSRMPLALTILLAVSLTASSWYALNRKIDRESASLQQQSANLQAQVSEFVKVLVDLEAAQASRGQPASDVSNQSKDSTAKPEGQIVTPAKQATKIPPKPPKHGKATSGDSAGQKGKDTKPAGTEPSHDSHVDHPATGSATSTPAASTTKTTQPATHDVFPDATKVTPPAGTTQTPAGSEAKPAATSAKPGDDSKSTGKDPKAGSNESKPTNSDPNKGTTAPAEVPPPGASR
ncbi:MAG: Mov34/MPN/PAD-1 family protein [Acidobacteriia bacterium]|nr:Mov34/MPN/PAD-1 family protein [Terriglobia bacterium]